MNRIIRFAGSRAWVPLAACLVVTFMLAGCGSAYSSAAAKASAVVSSTFTQQQLTDLENELVTSFQQQLASHPEHPISDVKAAVQEVFPNGAAGKILAYAASKYTPAVAASKGPGSARDLWAQKVVAYAVASGGVTPPASPSPGPLGTTSTADIPGYSPASAMALP